MRFLLALFLVGCASPPPTCDDIDTVTVECGGTCLECSAGGESVVGCYLANFRATCRARCLDVCPPT